MCVVVCWINAGKYSPGERLIECSFNGLRASKCARVVRRKNQAKGSPSEPRTHLPLHHPGPCRVSLSVPSTQTDYRLYLQPHTLPSLSAADHRSPQPQGEVRVFILSERQTQTQIIECSI